MLERWGQQLPPITEALIFVVVGLSIFEENTVHALALQSEIVFLTSTFLGIPQFSNPRPNRRLAEKGPIGTPTIDDHHPSPCSHAIGTKQKSSPNVGVPVQANQLSCYPKQI
jgi:hypothetical protein